MNPPSSTTPPGPAPTSSPVPLAITPIPSGIYQGSTGTTTTTNKGNNGNPYYYTNYYHPPTTTSATSPAAAPYPPHPSWNYPSAPSPPLQHYPSPSLPHLLLPHQQLSPLTLQAYQHPRPHFRTSTHRPPTTAQGEKKRPHHHHHLHHPHQQPHHHHNHHHKQQQPSQQQQQQQKQHQQDRPVVAVCDACTKEFYSEEEHAVHLKTHVKCSYCTFSASPKIISAHETHIHINNTYGIPNLDSPEVLAKWIEQRKKNYPTQANIERKKAETQLKIARGEKLSSSSSASPQKRKRGRHGHKGNDTGPLQKKKREDRGYENAGTGVKDERVGVKENSVIEKDSTEVKIEKIVGNGADTEVHLKTVRDDTRQETAGSDNDSDNDKDLDDDDEQPQEIPSNPVTDIKSPPPRNTRLCKYFVQGHCRKGDSCTFRHDKTIQRKNNNNRQAILHSLQKTKPSLLSKLLEKEIRNEKNVLLQCFRFIVLNDFFLKNEKPKIDSQ